MIKPLHWETLPYLSSGAIVASKETVYGLNDGTGQMAAG